VALGRRRADTVRYRKGQGMELDPRAAARDLSRVTRAAGAANVVDAAIPKTFRHLLASYWAQLALLFGLVLFVLGLPLLPWTLRGGLVWGGILVGIAGGFLGLRRAVWGWLARRRDR